MQIMIKNEVEFVSVEFSFVYCLLLLDPSLVMLAGISCLAFGSLFEATSNPQSVACLLQARLVLAVLPCWLFKKLLLLFKYSCLHFPSITPPNPAIPTSHP